MSGNIPHPGEEWRPPSLALEGGDGTGKHTLQLEIARLLIEGDHEVVMTNFPQYWFSGAYIRRMLKGRGAEVLSQLDPYQELELRAALFALDRAIALGLILPELTTESIVLSDRGPWSNAVTAGYVSSARAAELSVPISSEYVAQLIHRLDPEMLGTIGMDPILCLLDRSSGHGFSERVNLDQYEQVSVQESADRIYREIIPAQRHLQAKQGGDWRNVTELASEALAIAGIQTEITQPRSTNVLYQAEREGQLKLIGPQQMLDSWFPHVRLETRELEEHTFEWTTCTIGTLAELQGRNGPVVVKDRLGELERLTAEELTKVVNTYDADLTAFPPTARAAVGRLLSNYPLIRELMAAVAPEAGDGTQRLLFRMGEGNMDIEG